MKRESVFLFLAAFFPSLLLLGNCEPPVIKNLEKNKSLEIAKNIYGNPGEKKSLYLPDENGKNEGVPAQSIIKVVEKQSYKKSSDLGEKTNGKIKVYYLIKRKNKSGAVSVEKEENEDKIGYTTDPESSYEDIKVNSGSKENNKEKRENPAEGYENLKEKSGYNSVSTAPEGPENPEGDKIENVVPAWLNDEDEEILTPAASAAAAADVSGIESESGYEDGGYIGFTVPIEQTNLPTVGENKGGYDSSKSTGDNEVEKERVENGKGMETKEVSTWGTKIIDHQDKRENFHDTFELREKHHNVHQHMYNILLNNHHQKNIHEHTIYDKKINRHNIHTKNIIQPYIHVYNRVIQKVIPEEEHIVKEVIPVPGVETKVIHTESFKQIVPIIKHHGNDEMGVDTNYKQEQSIPLPSENNFGPTNPPKNGVSSNSPNFLTTTPPKSNYGPSTPSLYNFGPSNPPKNNFEPSNQLKNNYGPSTPSPNNFGPSNPPKNNFESSAPPKNNYGPQKPPKNNFGPPIPPNNFGTQNHPINNFGPQIHHNNDFGPQNPHESYFGYPVPHNNGFRPQNAQNNNFEHQIPQNNDFVPQNLHENNFEPQIPQNNIFGPQNTHENNFEPQIPHNNNFGPQNTHENNFEPQISHNNNFGPQNPNKNNFGPHNLPQINNGPPFPHNNDFRHHNPPKKNHGFPNLLMKMIENYQKPGIFSHGPSPFFKSTARPNFMSYHPQLINTYKTLMPIQSSSFEIQKPLLSYSESVEKKKPIVKEYYGFIEGNPGFVKIDGIPEITTPGHLENSGFVPGKPEDFGFNTGHPGNSGNFGFNSEHQGNSAGHPGFKNDITKNFGHNKPEENNYNFRRYGDVRATPSYKFLMAL